VLTSARPFVHNIITRAHGSLQDTYTIIYTCVCVCVCVTFVCMCVCACMWYFFEWNDGQYKCDGHLIIYYLVVCKCLIICSFIVLYNILYYSLRSVYTLRTSYNTYRINVTTTSTLECCSVDCGNDEWRWRAVMIILL
jgi:hypothetical protein